MVLLALVIITFTAIFFFILGKTISGKEPVLRNSISQPISSEFKIFVPSLGIDAEIVPNIDSTSYSAYLPIIDTKVAHGKFTYTPEEVFKNNSGITYLFSHQNSKASIFKNLESILVNENIYIKYNGNIYEYSVIAKTIVNPDQADTYTSQSQIPLLRIQTCTNGISQRLIVDARLQGIV
jgi:LPXTG-site transpeptidase (sortase) family protein